MPPVYVWKHGSRDSSQTSLAHDSSADKNAQLNIIIIGKLFLDIGQQQPAHPGSSSAIYKSSSGMQCLNFASASPSLIRCSRHSIWLIRKIGLPVSSFCCLRRRLDAANHLKPDISRSPNSEIAGGYGYIF